MINTGEFESGGAPINRCGHKGLFVDRLDVGVADAYGAELPRLAVDAELICYNRNRSYSPYHGRFLQSDPNSTGAPLDSASPYHGSCPTASLQAWSMKGLYQDGANIYGYLRASPWNLCDPTGLYSEEEWWDDTKEGAEALWRGYQTLTAGADPGGLIGAVLESMITNYSANLDADSEWASNWEFSDDLHTRTSSQWVAEAMFIGTAKHFGLDYWFEGESEESHGPAMGKTLTGSLKELVQMIIGEGSIFVSYSMAKAVKAAKGLGSLYHAHHLLPDAWAKLLGMNRNGPAVLLSVPSHQLRTTKLNNALRAIKQLPPSRQRAEALEQLRDIYSDKVEWLEHIEEMFGAR